MNDQRMGLLRVHQSTRGLDDDQLNLLAEQVEVVSCQEGTVVQAANENVEALLLVNNGRLRLSAILPTGEERTLHYVGRDGQFGLLTMVHDEPIPVQVTAVQNTRLLRIPANSAEQLMDEIPVWRRNLFEALGLRLFDSLLNKKQRITRRVVAFIHVSDEFRHLTSDLVERLTELGEQIGLFTDREVTDGAQPWKLGSLLDSAGRPKTPAEIRNGFSSWHEADRLILDASLPTVSEHLLEITDACEAVFWICSSEHADRVAGILSPLVAAAPGKRKKSFVIRGLVGDEQVAPWAPELAPLCGQEFKLHWHGQPDSPMCSRRAGIERIIHHLRGVCIGLALGGGAARGMAHLGVLQVLEDAGIRIDRLSGTSAALLTGIPYAAGFAADFLVDAFGHDLVPPWYYRLLPYGDAWYMLGKYRLGGWDRMLRKYLQSWRLEQLVIPFSSVAVDLVQAKQVIREAGDATHAILESINLPVLSRPICRESMTLIDGGILNVVPADVLVNQDANMVIASDVAARIRFEFAGNRPDTPTAQMKVPSTMQTTVRMRTVQDRNIRSMGGHTADIVIEPDVSQVLMTDFKFAAKIAKLGREAAEASLPEIRRMLHLIDPQLFPVTA